MDYRRIYAEFIEDRRRQQHAAGALLERHHILPRKVGGADDPSNLIYLTPADHFFAHLLLAKIHGGRLWVPIVLWCGGDKGNWRARKSRRNYAWAVAAAIRRLGGENAWQYDWTIHELEHTDGHRWSGTQARMHSELGLGRPLANLLVKRKIGSAKGWYRKGERPRHVGRGNAPGNNHNLADRRIYHWTHLSGREFRGTRVDFCSMSGVSKKSACLIVNGQQVISKGWTLYGSKIPTRGGATHKSQKTPEPCRAKYCMVRKIYSPA